MAAKLKAIKAELQRRKHHRTTEVGAWLRKVVWATTNTIPFRATRLSCASLASRWLVVAERIGSSQSTRTGAMGSSLSSPEPLDSKISHSALISQCPIRRHSSMVRAVCVNVLVRICAGGDQRWSSPPRQLTHYQPVELFLRKSSATVSGTYG